MMWSYNPRKPSELKLIFRLGYLRTAEWVYSQSEGGGAFDHVMKGPLPDKAERETRLAATKTELVSILALISRVVKGKR